MNEHDDDHIDEYPENHPCFYCGGKGWLWSHDKKWVCPVCHGKGIEEEG